MPFTRTQIKELLDKNLTHRCDGFGSAKICVRIIAIDELLSRFGDFYIFTFYNSRDSQEHAAIVSGDVGNAENVPVRVHSECLTGDVIGSLRCDCRDQLETALKQIGQMENGILLYLRQSGPGLGLINKIRAYSLQDHGYDTMGANLVHGLRDDERDYSAAAHMLFSLNVKSIRLMTNNRRTVENLAQHRVVVNGVIPVIVPPNPYNEFYLKTTMEKSGNLLDSFGKLHLQEQGDHPIIDGMSPEQFKDLYQE